jgi:hypothetical protein
MELILVIDADWLYQTYPYRSVSHNMKTISAKYLRESGKRFRI